MSARETYHIRIRGNVLGPFRLEQVLKMIERGQLTRRHEVSCDGSEWRPAGDLPELFAPQSPPGAPTPAMTEAGPEVSSFTAWDANASRNNAWYYEYDGREHGPVPGSQLAQLIAKGLVGAQSRVWKEGMADWQPVHATELAGYLPAANEAPIRRPQLTESTHMRHKPTIPGIIHAGWILYVVGFIVDLVTVAAGSIASNPMEGPPPPEAAVFLGIFICAGVLLFIMDVLGVLMATLGYAWGAVLRIVVFVLCFPLNILVILLSADVPGVCVMSCLSFLLGVASFVCFVVPPAWEYYRACKAYRMGRLADYQSPR